PIVRPDDRSEVLPEVNLAALQHRHGVAPGGLDQFHLHIGIVLGVAMQEHRLHAFDMLRRGADLEDADIAALQGLGVLADGAGGAMRSCSAALDTVPSSATVTKVRA